MKFLAVVVACGMYQGHNHICLEWTDQAWYSTRAQCIKRGGEIVDKVKSLVWYAGIKMDRSPVPSCREKTD